MNKWNPDKTLDIPEKELGDRLHRLATLVDQREALNASIQKETIELRIAGAQLKRLSEITGISEYKINKLANINHDTK